MPDSDIITYCPQCNTAFRVTSSQLMAANGMVRCGNCLAVFKAGDHQSKLAYPLSLANRVLGDNKLSGTRKEPRIYEVPETRKASETHKTTGEKNLTSTKSVDLSKNTRSATEATKSAFIGKSEKNSLKQLIRDGKDASEPFFKDTAHNPEDIGRNNTNRFGYPLKSGSRKDVDESWALNILAEMKEDDSPQSLKLTRKPETIKPTETVIAKPTKKLSAATSRTEKKRRQTRYTSRTNPEKPSLNEISDVDIEDAIKRHTDYARDSQDYLSSIEPAPVELEWLESSSTRQWLWATAAILASFILLIQIAVFRFETLSKSSTYRPFYQIACDFLDCQLPALINTEKIRATNLVVRTHPTQENALVIDAILLNTADFPQPYPALKLEFSNIDNQVVAARVLQPRDYLRGELIGATQMPSRQPIQLALDIVDPGSQAVNYQLMVVHTP